MAFALSSTVLLAIRAVQALFAIIVLGTAGYVASWWTSTYHAGSPGETNFLIFDAVWTLLVLIYLVVVPMRFSGSAAHHRFVILGLEALTMLFWFAGFIALAVWVSPRVCFGSVCHVAKAASVFGGLEWLLFAITTAFATLHAIRPGHSTTTMSGKHATGPGPMQSV